ncbi:DNA-3-methyladenine glycosylase [Chitinophaga ginsengisegetis]|uniref:Putative 3-methyladenine DNA glycosylase n=1 Tax=Chitinophaga ginsengisegetis TaxID=393003 RepID=A0A1T5PAT4_9BACT|nr:DNA-3-methyladenine glycosylase [Chitinophaga ginsengisegetis]SKD09786.1 DNA-3-methyladenine glycosylase [Chitinophaga ginsengisegetis]
MAKLKHEFYQQHEVTTIAKQLLGKILVTHINGVRTAGMIVETEAYAGSGDRASHAWNNRRTKRTEVMYKPGGFAYVYLCYGIHYLFNVVTNIEDTPHAVLIRALQPVDGIEMMKQRYNNKPSVKLTAGPGSLCKAMGIDAGLNGESLTGKKVWIESGKGIPEDAITVSTRVGVQYAGEDAYLPYRFSIKNNDWVSKGKGL